MRSSETQWGAKSDDGAQKLIGREGRNNKRQPTRGQAVCFRDRLAVEPPLECHDAHPLSVGARRGKIAKEAWGGVTKGAHCEQLHADQTAVRFDRTCGRGQGAIARADRRAEIAAD